MEAQRPAQISNTNDIHFETPQAENDSNNDTSNSRQNTNTYITHTYTRARTHARTHARTLTHRAEQSQFTASSEKRKLLAAFCLFVFQVGFQGGFKCSGLHECVPFHEGIWTV